MHTFFTECLDRLMAERPEKHRSLPLYPTPALLSRVTPIYSTSSSFCTPSQVQPPCPSINHPQYAHFQPQLPCYQPPMAAHPSKSFALYSPCGEPAAAESLSSPMASKMPPPYNLQAEYTVGLRSMQDFMNEGDTGYDIDTLNPSLTDLQLPVEYKTNQNHKLTSRG